MQGTHPKGIWERIFEARPDFMGRLYVSGFIHEPIKIGSEEAFGILISITDDEENIFGGPYNFFLPGVMEIEKAVREFYNHEVFKRWVKEIPLYDEQTKI